MIIRNKKLLILLVFFCFIISLSTVSAEYTDNNISIDPTDSISDAVDSATKGDTIYLNEGTYYANGILVNKDLTFIGNGSADKVIIDGSKKGVMFQIRDKAKVSFVNITFINGQHAYGESGAVIDSRGCTLNIDNCRFINNSAGYNGGAVSNAREGSIAGKMVLTNSIFIGNDCVHDGGAVSTYLSESIIKNCQFYNNTAGRDGGAIRVKFSDYHLIDNCTFMYNLASGGNGWGGAIYTWTDVDSYIYNCYIVSNYADEAGAGITSASRLVAINNTIVNNTAGIMGGGIYIYEEGEEKYSTAVFHDNDIYGNIILRPHLEGNGGMDVYISDVVTEGNLLNFNDNYWGTNNPLNSTDYPYIWKDRFDTNGKTVILNSWLVKKVETKLVGEDISLFYKNGTKYEVILLDNDGNPISNQNIDITIKNVHYVLVSDKNGSVSLPINLMPGKYDVSVTYKGNDNYYNSTTQSVITVLSLNDDNSSSVDKNDSADEGNTSSVDNNGSAGNGADSSIKVPTVGNKNWAVGKGVFKNSLKFKNNVNSVFKDIYDVIKIILDAIDSAYASMFAYINETSKGNSTNLVLSFLCFFDWILH